MANTHQQISDNAMMEFSFLSAKVTQQYILLKEISPFCMLPSPLNIVTTVTCPIHYILVKQGVSLAGSIADKILIIPGQCLSYCLLLLLFLKSIPTLFSQILKDKTTFMFPVRLFFMLTFPIWLFLLVALEGLLASVRHPLLQIQTDGTFCGLEANLKVHNDSINEFIENPLRSSDTSSNSTKSSDNIVTKLRPNTSSGDLLKNISTENLRIKAFSSDDLLKMSSKTSTENLQTFIENSDDDIAMVNIKRLDDDEGKEEDNDISKIVSKTGKVHKRELFSSSDIERIMRTLQTKVNTGETYFSYQLLSTNIVMYRSYL